MIIADFTWSCSFSSIDFEKLGVTSDILLQLEVALSLDSAEACDKMPTKMFLGNINHRSARKRIAFMVLEFFIG